MRPTHAPTPIARRASRAPATRPPRAAGATLAELATLGIQLGRRTRTRASDVEGETISPDAYSRGEVLRHRDFDRMTAAELRDAERLVDLLRPEARAAPDPPLRAPPARPAAGAAGDVPAQPGDRRAHRVGLAAPDPRAAPARRAVRHLGLDGAPLAAAAAVRPGAGAHDEVRTESFVFGTRLTRVTRLLKDRDRDRALAQVADTVTDWAGGTRIGESFREFNHQWARRTLRTQRRRHRRVRRLGPRRPGARGRRDGPPAPQLPPPRLAQPAGSRPATSRSPPG